MLKKLLFLGCLPHALVGILYQYKQNHSKAERKRHAVTVYKVRSSSEICIITATRKQNRKIHYLNRIHGREAGVQVIIQHLKGETEGTKSSRGPDPEIKLHKALKGHFLSKLTNPICYFLDFKHSADTLKKADNSLLKARKDESSFSSHRDMPLLTDSLRDL